jgi:DNA-binding response OmpR family regulator
LLLVDDDVDLLQALTVVLESEGAHVLTAESVREALLRFVRHSPDAIISDISLPSYDGYAFIKEVRHFDAHLGRHTPALAITGLSSAYDRDEAMRAGFNDYMTKPLDPESLVHRVQALMLPAP